MPLSGTLKRHASYSRRIAWSSAIIGVVFFVLFVLVLLMLTWQKRVRQHEQLLLRSSEDLQQVIATLEETLFPLQQYTQLSCSSVSRELTSRAAFADNIRAILLVRDGNAYCSSATGAFLLPARNITPASELGRDRDIQLLPGTPLLPTRPAVALWLKNPGAQESGILATINISLTPYQLLASYHPEITGMALVIGDNALLSGTQQVVHVRDLPPALAALQLPGHTLQFRLYGSTLAPRDYHLALLTGLLFSLLISAASWLILQLRRHPGREILQGIRRGEFHVEYQPLVTAPEGRPYGIEALLRWTHPVEGMIPPDAFISYAEAQNLIIPLTRHLFTLVARDAQALCQQLPRGTRLSLNLSPLHLACSEFRQHVQAWIADMPADHFSYVFEITERSMVREKNAGEIFAWLHENNVKIAIDDFGTGHSALIYLEKYPFDYLKIDRGFVQSIGTETLTSPVLDAVLLLAKKLNLKTVAEGVETRDQAAWLVKRGVTHLQGYLFSRPLRPEKLLSYYQNQARLG
ncbi:cyclic di-GMP phosphodiesterase [Candidatus Pantoea soli]|uniref:cyclic-guanylate-specific phosphodiesterase n=1 Tax=Candidatus Pantoea soli TaxID=3098669 RepID=A0A518XE29_9GAMM|nr:cyclic di-GMP phosphodiesterase [Pantoea soli]QDY42467.1 cyclic di-GMP phosphodiesterase [Pantoea soli]